MQAVSHVAYACEPYFTMSVTPLNHCCVPLKVFHGCKVYAMLP